MHSKKRHLFFFSALLAGVVISPAVAQDEENTKLPDCSKITYLECAQEYLSQIKLASLRAQLVTQQSTTLQQRVAMEKEKDDLREIELKRERQLGFRGGANNTTNVLASGTATEETAVKADDLDVLLDDEPASDNQEPSIIIPRDVKVALIESLPRGGFQARLHSTELNIADWVKLGDTFAAGTVENISPTTVTVNYGQGQVVVYAIR